jgi:hypothetical protein
VRSVKLPGAAAVVVFAVLAAASSAFGGTGPEFLIEGSLLPSTESIEAQGSSSQALTSTGVALECSGVSLEGGNLFATNPGTDEETLVYSGCTYQGKTAAECEARTKAGGTAGQIKTVALASELGYKAATGPDALTLFRPKVGTEFVSVEFKGTSCPLTETKVKGSVAVENESVENVNEVLTAPAVAINKFFNAAGVETKPKLTVTGGFTATYAGKVEVWLSGASKGKPWGVIRQCEQWRNNVLYPFGWKVKSAGVFWESLVPTGNLNHEPREPEAPQLWQKVMKCP